MPPVAADSALGAGVLALIAHERAGSADEMHPVLEQAFQFRQLDRAKVVIAAAGPILTADLLKAAKAVLLYTEEPEAFLPLEAALKELENAIAKAEGRTP